MNLLEQRLYILQRIDGKIMAGLHGRSMLNTARWSGREIGALFALAGLFEKLDRAGVSPKFCRDELFYGLFYDDSVLSRAAWSGAAARLGASPVNLDWSLPPTGLQAGIMLGMNVHAFGIRHCMSPGRGHRFMVNTKRGIMSYLHAIQVTRSVPVLSLQCDLDHPTQTLSDLSWLLEYSPKGLRGRSITVSWAPSTSHVRAQSVPTGLISLLTRFGAHVRLAHPVGFDLPTDSVRIAETSATRSKGSFLVTNDQAVAFRNADVVYPMSWAPQDLLKASAAANKRGDGDEADRIRASCIDRSRENADWICDEKKMALTEKGTGLYMHCLPADVGHEVSAGVMGNAALNVARQAHKKLYIIMAVLASSKIPDLQDRMAAVVRSLEPDPAKEGKLKEKPKPKPRPVAAEKADVPKVEVRKVGVMQPVEEKAAKPLLKPKTTPPAVPHNHVTTQNMKPPSLEKPETEVQKPVAIDDLISSITKSGSAKTALAEMTAPTPVSETKTPSAEDFPTPPPVPEAKAIEPPEPLDYDDDDDPLGRTLVGFMKPEGG
jgi:ornithine carbamoyltransferase